MIAVYNILTIAIMIMAVCLIYVLRIWDICKSWFIANSVFYIVLLTIFSVGLANSCASKDIVTMIIFVVYTTYKAFGLSFICRIECSNMYVNRVYNRETDQIKLYKYR